ncbi:MAG: AMP-binding protein [Bacteroidia bacterium]|nr:AMP-binding protein [Bacteroidia bacterium]
MTPSSPLEKFLYWEKENPERQFLRQPFSGQWKTWTYAQAGDEARKIAASIQSLNLPKKSHIALLSKNCAQWIMANLAIMMAGHISIPLYPTLTAESIQQILEHSGTKVIFIGKLDFYDQQKNGIPAAVLKIGIETYGVHETKSWENIIKTENPIAEIYSWQKDDLITIIYTSGTTGKPKGVMHTVEAFDTVVRVAMSDLNIPHRPKLFSYLPLSHIAERMGIEMIGLYSGADFSFSESLEQFPKNLADTQPNIFFAVPRIWAKFQEKILEKLPQKKLSMLLSIPIVSMLVKNKIKKGMGLSNATHIYSGAAPISPDLVTWFEKIGVVIFQAYGMTEDCVYSHFNRHGANRLGTVGQKLSGLQVKIAEDGEFRLKSVSNLKGYYKEPELTAEAFDEEGFLKTGDMGEYDKDGFLKITGRAKDQFKTDKGKYISPTPIEMKLLVNTDVEQACVVGMGIPQPIALFVLSAAGKKKSKEQIIQSLSGTLAEINPGLQKYEKLEKAVILKDDWTIENGLLTPTMKVKRNEVEKIHIPKYATWYHKQDGVVLWE